ncbi:hypothetical protein [Winogradskyella vincentii]|uniref:Transporter n=1 Tax=Winogradskyella vincentii TaxID=2877122 RepID=A0ABS7Y082_9FLAO|nr:hypothetical protein [Winogradskyella vincentii]MCA0152670.1 hypothetical protein [Winogradskyella vincentii]
MKFRIFLLGFCLAITKTSFSQTCCSGGIPLSNNLGLEFSSGQSAILGLSYDFNNLNTLKNENETLDDNSRLRTTHSILLNAGYSFTDRLSIEGLFTWVNQRRIISQFDEENLDQTYGIGDAVILVRYKVINNIEKSFRLDIGFGVKLPLGSSTETNDQGIVLNADLQPGSNSWDLIYLLGANKSFDFRPTMAFSTRLIYRQTGENNSYFDDSTYEFGNDIQAYFGVSDQFLVQNTVINPRITFKYRNAAQDKINTADLPNTGGEWIFIIPNLSVSIFKNTSLNVSAELPIYSRPEGIQLTPTYRITSGFLINLFNKPQAVLN